MRPWPRCRRRADSTLQEFKKQIRVVQLEPAAEPAAKNTILYEEKVYNYESQCEEAFSNPKMGGVAFSLPHGSVLPEVAKHEFHGAQGAKPDEPD